MKQFHLTWSDYLTSVSDSFINHRECALFTDVTLVTVFLLLVTILFLLLVTVFLLLVTILFLLLVTVFLLLELL